MFRSFACQLTHHRSLRRVDAGERCAVGGLRSVAAGAHCVPRLMCLRLYDYGDKDPCCGALTPAHDDGDAADDDCVDDEDDDAARRGEWLRF